MFSRQDQEQDEGVRSYYCHSILYSLTPIKAIQIGKEDIKLSLFVDDIILYMKNPKQSTKKLLVLINKFSGLTGYKIIYKITCKIIYKNQYFYTLARNI